MSRVELDRTLGWLPPELSGVRLEFSADGLIASCVRRDGAVSQQRLPINPYTGATELSRWLEAQGLQAENAAAAADVLISRQFDVRQRPSGT